MSLPRGWPHQLPRIGPPATASARLGTDPRADCRTIPCLSTNAGASAGRITRRPAAAGSFRETGRELEVLAGPPLVDHGREEEDVALAVAVEAGRGQVEPMVSHGELPTQDRPAPLAPPRELAAVDEDAGSAPGEAP